MFTLPSSLLTQAPMHHKLKPQPFKPVKTISTNDGIVTSAENVYRRRMVDLKHDVYLMDGRNRKIESLKPAMGELLRKPTLFIAIVFDQQGHEKEVFVRAWQPLSVK